MSDEVDLKTPAAAGADPTPAPNAAPVGGDPPSDPPAQNQSDPSPHEGGDNILGSGDPDHDKTVVQAEFPKDWREKWAKGDDKLMKRLERFSDPSKVFQSWLAAEQKISSGEYKKGLDPNASDEDKAAWRKENGIPEEADAYVPTKIEGLEWSDADKPMLDAFFGSMHKVNASQDQVDAALNAYAEIVQQQNEARAEADKAYLNQTEDALRAKYGDEFRANVNVFRRLLEDKDGGPIHNDVVQALLTARDESGNRVINNPAVADYLINLGLDHYGTPMERGEGATATSRLEEINRVMKTDFNRYLAEGLDKEKAKIMERQAGRKGGQQSGPAYYDP